MDTNDSLTLFAIIIALSAYLATLRWLTIVRIGKSVDNEDKQILKKSLQLITLPDVPLVISAVLLFAHIFWIYLLGTAAPDFLFTWSVYLFAISFLTLIAYHIIEWYKTFTI